MKKIFSIIFISFFALSASEKTYFQKFDTNAKIKAVYIYNFTKYIEWPQEYQMDEFVVGILGESEALYNELESMSKVKKVGNRNFTIVNYPHISSIEKSHILFVPYDHSNKLSQVIEKLRNRSTIVITEKPGMLQQGASINFVVEMNKQKFEINKTRLAKKNLNVSETLEKMSLTIN